MDTPDQKVRIANGGASEIDRATADEQPEPYDLVVIGAGPAGQSGAQLAASFGLRAVVVERNRPGGTVTTTGGAPGKTLREAALYLTGFRDRDVYGLHIDAPPEVVVQKIAARTQQVTERLQQQVARDLAEHGVAYLQGRARIGPDQVVVTTPEGNMRRLAGKAVLVATGSRPLRSPGIDFEDPDVCDTDEFFSLGRVPHDLFIAGGGPIGVEFATIAHALGVPVTLSDMADRLLPLMDGELSRQIAATFEDWGVRVLLGAGTRRIDRVDGQLEIELTNGMTLHNDAVLFAAGRSPNTESLGLAEARVELDSRGRIVVDEKFRTTADGIYAAGDVIGPSLASVAMEQGAVAVCHAFGIPLRDHVDPITVGAVYGMPEIASAGLTEEQCQTQGIDYAVGRCDLATVARGAIAGHGGILKLLFRRDDHRLVGVHCIGDIASELVGFGQLVIHFGGRLADLNAVTINSPTYTAAYKYAAFDALHRLTEAPLSTTART